jgi:predicted peptidase
VYVMGLSMGGFGTWDLVTRYPKRFAAAVPICGGGDPGRVESLGDLPLWVFHGADDEVVAPIYSRRMVEAIRAAGGDPRYTEYPGVGHNSWDPAFAEPELFPWLFAQRQVED